ncbi:MAG: class I SAM-dependent methyltransferase, partial [Pirellulaceae bacterium]|nr:class I SAM-dependent methyltransferase [Pirellulaceae bacterium]
MIETLDGNLYDYPSYYDLVYGSDWKAEFDFLVGCFQQFARIPVNHVFEPACGTGRLLYRLAASGLQVSGLDLNPHAVDYCNQRLERKGFQDRVICEDMTDFQLESPVDAGFNMINSFRHLVT